MTRNWKARQFWTCKIVQGRFTKTCKNLGINISAILKYLVIYFIEGNSKWWTFYLSDL